MTTTIFGLLLLIVPATSPTLLEKGDDEFARVHYPRAVAIYDSALSTATDSAEVLWRIARVYVCKADVSPKDEKLGLYRLAESFAQRCITADSTISQGHTWLAAALGNIAMYEGSKAKIRLCYSIKKELECSIHLNPLDDIAYSILGTFYKTLGNVSWFERRLAAIFLGSLPEGGYVDSEEALKKAIALAPMIIRHHFELADLYVQENRTKEALEEFQLVTTLPPLLASDSRTQQSAEGMIRTLKEE